MHKIIRVLAIPVLTLLPIVTYAQVVYKLDGKIGGKYPVAIGLEEFDEGLFSGWYSYRSTHKRSGDKVCSWLQINPSYEYPATQWDIRDCKPNLVETWSDVRFDGKRLSARMKNTLGKSYDVVATVTQQVPMDPSLTPYYKQLIGEMVCDFDMFNYLPVKFRLIDCMGIENYFALKEIYQTQGDIQYSKSIFWGSGYMAHQYCDPATVWAYDTDNNSFYVWIRQDGQDYWWSESGNIPIKFREIVGETF